MPLAFLLLCALPAAAGGRSAAAPPVTVTALRCEYETNPIGIDAERPRLSWRLESAERGQRQTAYQILVATTPQQLAAGKADLWDSGRVTSDQSIQVEYTGKPLGSMQRAFWAVRVWDRAGRVTPYSPAAFWEMGLLKPSDWQARWIGLNTSPPTPASVTGASWIWLQGDPANPSSAPRYFRRRFEIPAGSKIESAMLRVAADDEFALFVNGRQAGRNERGWDHLHEFDIAGRLKPGANVVAILVRNSMGPAGLLAALDVALDGGRKIALSTDAQWKVNGAGPTGWQGESFIDSAWTPARVLTRFGGEPWSGLRVVQAMGPPPHLRREFSVDGPVRRARLYATALGVYEARLNGKRVGDHIFAPGWTDYSKRVHVQTYDVTGLLKQGRNALGIILGDGWYAGYVGLGGRNRYGPQPLALAQLEVEYADGKSAFLATDDRWRAAAGPILQSDMLMGEIYDARKEPVGWDQPGYAAANWRPVETHQPEVKLEAQKGPPVRRMEILPAKTVREPKPGQFVFDLGQNISGWARLKVRGPAGTTITLRFAEMLNPDGTIYTANYRSAKCTDRYTLRGGGEEIFEPHFTFRGYQYVEVTGYPGKPAVDAISGVALYSDTPPAGKFACSNPLVNRLQSNIVWGQKGNFLSIPTDCPQRDERLGWTGDAQVFIRTASFNMDVAGFFNKWLVDLNDAQGANGAYPDVAPRVAAGEGTAAWADAGVICPWTIYLCYGDRRVIERCWDGMVRWVEYCRTNSKELIRPAQGYGDWLNVNDETPKDLIGTAYFAHSTDLLSRMARVIGKTDEAERLRALFQQIKAAFNKAFVSDDGRLKGNTQTGYVLALHFDLLPEDLREKAADHLAAHIEARKGHLTTGFLGVGYLLPTLTRAGRLNVAYRLLLNETYPSWGYAIKQGATTIWERWDGWTADRGFQDPGMNSFNHYSLGSVGEWLYETVAGIAPDQDGAGYRRINIRPRPGGGLTWARGELLSPLGRVVSSWRVEGGRFQLEVTVPVNAQATIRFPSGATPDQVREGDRPLSESTEVRILPRQGEGVVVRVGSGTYRFSAPWSEAPVR